MYDYGFRIYDTIIGRLLKIDPLTQKYASYAPYSFAGNKVIEYRELEGLEEAKFNTTLYDPVLRNAPPKERKIVRQAQSEVMELLLHLFQLLEMLMILL